MYKLNAKVNVWQENKQISVMIKATKKRVQEIIKAKTGLSVDKPDPVGAGGTTTGTMARKLLFDPSKRHVLVDCIPEKIQGDGRCDRKVFNEFITNLSVIPYLPGGKSTLKVWKGSAKKHLNFGKAIGQTSDSHHQYTSASTFCFTYSSK